MPRAKKLPKPSPSPKEEALQKLTRTKEQWIENTPKGQEYREAISRWDKEQYELFGLARETPDDLLDKAQAFASCMAKYIVALNALKHSGKPHISMKRIDPSWISHSRENYIEEQLLNGVTEWRLALDGAEQELLTYDARFAEAEKKRKEHWERRPEAEGDDSPEWGAYLLARAEYVKFD